MWNHSWDRSNFWGKILLFGILVLLFKSDVSSASSLPLPRFASLKSQEVNVRKGPGPQYPIAWILVRPGLPVEITEEFGNWRKIRDWEGEVGWVHYSLLTGKKTVMVTQPQSILKVAPEEKAAGLALLEKGVIGVLLKTEGDWCQIKVDEGLKGWLNRGLIWGGV